MKIFFWALVALFTASHLSANEISFITADRSKNFGTLVWQAGTHHNNMHSVNFQYTAKEDSRLIIQAIDMGYKKVFQNKKYIYNIKQGQVLNETLWLQTYANNGSVHYHFEVNDLSFEKLSTSYVKGNAGGNLRAALIAEKDSEFFNRLSGHVGLSMTGGRNNELTIAKFKPAAAANSYQGYSGYDFVIVHNLQDDVLTEPQVNAIENWLILGGSLIWIDGPKSRLTKVKKRLLQLQDTTQSPIHLKRRGQGYYQLFNGKTLLEKYKEDIHLRKSLLQDFIKRKAYIRIKKDNHYSWHYNQDVRDSSDIFGYITKNLFTPPPMIMAFFIFIGSVITLQPLNRFILNKKQLTSYYPLTVVLGSFIWLLLIYLLGVGHHGLGSHIRHLVIWDHLEHGKHHVTETNAMITSYAKSETFSVPQDADLSVLNADAENVNLTCTDKTTINKYPIAMWKPTVFSTSAIRDLGGHIELDNMMLTNNTDMSFEHVLVFKNHHFYTNTVELDKGEIISLSPVKKEFKTRLSTLRHWLEARGYRKTGYEFNTLIHLLETKQRSFIFAIGESSPSLSIDRDDWDSSMIIYMNSHVN